MELRWILLFILSFGPSAYSAEAAEPGPSAVSFNTRKIKVKDVTLKVEIADTPERFSRGLMYRKNLPADSGMLFIFPHEQTQSFWMKNTFIPLSIGFFDAKKRLVDIQDMEPVKSEMDMRPPSYVSRKPAQFALEVPKGWFAKHRIKVEDKFDFID